MKTAADPLPGRATVALAVLCAVFFVAGFAMATLGPVLPALSSRTGASLAELGRLISAIFVGSILAQFVSGAASDRFGRRRVLGAGLALFAASTGLVAFSTSLALTLGAAMLLGLGYGSSTLAGNVMSAELVPERRASSVNLVNMFYGLGAVAGPLVVSVLLRRTGESLPAVWIGAALLALSAAFCVWTLPDHLPAAPAADTAGAPARTVSLRDPLLLAWGVFLMLYVGSEIAAGTWATTYLQQSAGMDAAKGAAATSLFWGALTLGRVAAVVAGMRVAAEHLLTASVWLTCAGAALLWAGHGSATTSVVALAILGAGFGPIYPTGVAVITSHFPHAAGTATSRMGILAAAGGALLPWLHGLVLAHRPSSQSALFTLVVTILMIAVWERTRRLAHRPHASV